MIDYEQGHFRVQPTSVSCESETSLMLEVVLCLAGALQTLAHSYEFGAFSTVRVRRWSGSDKWGLSL